MQCNAVGFINGSAGALSEQLLQWEGLGLLCNRSLSRGRTLGVPLDMDAASGANEVVYWAQARAGQLQVSLAALPAAQIVML